MASDVAMNSSLEKAAASVRRWSVDVWLALVVGLLLVWTFWPTFQTLAGRWIKDAEYSHGYLVPLFSAYLLWARRGILSQGPVQPSWWGLVVMAGGLLLRFAGTYTYFDWLAAAAFVPCLAGVFVLSGGWQALRWAWPALAFLLFMIPFPYRFEIALAQPLQRVATAASTYTIQTLGISAYADGNVIRLGAVQVGVVEACSGLSMLLIFFALSTAFIAVVKMPWPEQIVIIVSAIPIAIIANVIRITLTAILHKTAGAELANFVFHDLAGWLMMPLALGLLWLEMKLMAWIIIPSKRTRVGSNRPAQSKDRLGPSVGRSASQMPKIARSKSSKS